MPLLVFTDLDGTLISHTDYSWEAARPALARLKKIGAGVVLASSKTAPEMAAIRRDLGLEGWPAIVENGAGLLAENCTATPENDAYRALRKVLAKIPATLRDQFCGFGDMDVAEVAKCTGLSADAATMAKQRAFSEPGLWSGSPTHRRAFLHALASQGVTAREGGRFLTLSFGQTKADQMAKIISQFTPRCTVALGDAPNDIEMLEAADFGFIIANPHHDPLPVLSDEATGRITRTTNGGPEGWNTALLDLITRLKLE